MEGWILVCPLAKCGGSHAYVVHSAIVFSISMHGKHNRRVDDCFGKLRSRNFVQTVPLSSNFVLREWVLPRLLARANMDPGSRKESRFSISSGVIQNDFSASILYMVLQIFSLWSLELQALSFCRAPIKCWTLCCHSFWKNGIFFVVIEQYIQRLEFWKLTSKMKGMNRE